MLPNAVPDMIVQVYRSISDYLDGKYPNYAFDPQRKMYPMVVTLEDWFLMGPKLLNEEDLLGERTGSLHDYRFCLEKY